VGIASDPPTAAGNIKMLIAIAGTNCGDWTEWSDTEIQNDIFLICTQPIGIAKKPSKNEKLGALRKLQFLNKVFTKYSTRNVYARQEKTSSCTSVPESSIRVIQFSGHSRESGNPSTMRTSMDSRFRGNDKRLLLLPAAFFLEN